MELAWFGHGTLRLYTFGKTILVDPIRADARLGTSFQPDSEGKAGLVLLTGEKRDQVEPETVGRVLEPRGTVIGTKGSLKALLVAGRTDVAYAVAGKGEVYPFGEHVQVRCLPRREGSDPGAIYVVQGGETIVFLGEALMDKGTWAYHASGIVPDAVVFPPSLCLRDKSGAEAFREWVAMYPAIACIPVLYHSGTNGDPSRRVDQETIPALLPPGARLDLLTSRPLVARETRRMRRRT